MKLNTSADRSQLGLFRFQFVRFHGETFPVETSGIFLLASRLRFPEIPFAFLKALLTNSIYEPSRLQFLFV
jgi:hypothetical protein